MSDASQHSIDSNVSCRKSVSGVGDRSDEEKL